MLLIEGLISHTAMLKQLLHKPCKFKGHLSKYFKKDNDFFPQFVNLSRRFIPTIHLRWIPFMFCMMQTEISKKEWEP